MTNWLKESGGYPILSSEGFLFLSFVLLFACLYLYIKYLFRELEGMIE